MMIVMLKSSSLFNYEIFVMAQINSYIDVLSVLDFPKQLFSPTGRPTMASEVQNESSKVCEGRNYFSYAIS